MGAALAGTTIGGGHRLVRHKSHTCGAQGAARPADATWPAGATCGLHKASNRSNVSDQFGAARQVKMFRPLATKI